MATAPNDFAHLHVYSGKYGSDHVAQIVTFGTMLGRASAVSR